MQHLLVKHEYSDLVELLIKDQNTRFSWAYLYFFIPSQGIMPAPCVLLGFDSPPRKDTNTYVVFTLISPQAYY